MQFMLGLSQKAYSLSSQRVPKARFKNLPKGTGLFWQVVSGKTIKGPSSRFGEADPLWGVVYV